MATLNNGSFTLASLVGLAGVTNTGIQFHDTGTLRIGNGNPTTLTDSGKHLSVNRFNIGGSDVTINLTNCSIDVRDIDDLNTFGSFAFAQSAINVSLALANCHIIADTCRLIVGFSNNSQNLTLDRCNIETNGLALYGSGTILKDTTFRNMAGAESGGLGIRTTFATPPQNIAIVNSVNGFNLRGSDAVQIEGASFFNVNFDFYVQSGGASTFTANCLADNLQSNFIIFWKGAASGTITRRHTITFGYTNQVNAPLENLRVYLASVAGVQALNSLSNSSGTLPNLKLVRSVYSYGGVALSTATTEVLRTPYILRERLCGYIFFEDLNFSFDAQVNIRAKRFPNLFFTAADSSAALAVTNPTTEQSIYNHSQAQYGTENYMQYATVLNTVDGVTLNVNCNVQINNALSAIAYTPTTPAIAVSAFNVTTFGTLQLGQSCTIDLVQAATYSAPWSIPASGVVTVAEGTSNLSTWEFASGSQVNLRAGATAATVVVGVGQDANITAGPGVTLEAVRPSTVVQGFPTAANIHGANPAPVMFVYDASNWALLAAFDILDPEYSDGTFTIIPGGYSSLLSAGTSIMVVGDAVGWRRTTATTIDITNPQTIIDLSFEEYVNEAGLAFMGSVPSAVGLSYDNVNSRIEVESSSGGSTPRYRFAEVGYRLDLLTSTKAGGAFNLDLIRQITYISNDTYKRILIPGAIKVAATSTAATSPILEDFTLISLDNSDPFTHGLPSDVVGLTTRPEVVINFQAPPTSVTLEDGNKVDLADEVFEDLTRTIKGYVETGARRVLGEVER